jgi:ParB-like chromosome segregation protein Spo0J
MTGSRETLATINVEYIKVSDLVPYVANSRTHSDEQVAQIAASIKEFGFTNPILTDGENGIIAGHGRLMAARKLGLAEVPTIPLVGLTAAQKRAYVIADNKLALNAGWDAALLSSEIAGLGEDGFDLSLLGFSDSE